MLNSNSETLTVLSIDPPLVSEKCEESWVSRGRVQPSEQGEMKPKLSSFTVLADAPAVAITFIRGYTLVDRDIKGTRKCKTYQATDSNK